MKGTCRKGHDLNIAENAVVGVRTDGSAYRYCKVCSTARARDKAAAVKAAKALRTDIDTAVAPAAEPDPGPDTAELAAIADAAFGVAAFTDGSSPIPVEGDLDSPSPIPVEGDLP